MELLERVSTSKTYELSPVQRQVDELVDGFVHEATEWRSLAAMMAGGVAYRVGRVGADGFRIGKRNSSRIGRLWPFGRGLGV